MTRKRTFPVRGLVPVLVLVLVAAVFAGRVIAGQFDSVDASAFQADLATGSVVRIADIPATDGHPGRGVFAQVTDEGRFCLWDAPSLRSRERRGGCNPASDPLGGSALSASLSYEGGPAIADVRDARLIGLAAPSVAGVELAMSDGSSRSMPLRKTSVASRHLLAFGYRLREADLGKGVGPVAVVALDANGVEVARQPTGIGS